jgi:DNA (cytosine-5)-methyltransferase 1
MRLLDLYCGSFGAGHGYQLAGWDVTGVDIVRRADVPPGVHFIRADVLDVLADPDFLRTFDAVHTSPPCKVHTRLAHLMSAQGGTPIHGDHVSANRAALGDADVPYILENVEGAPMRPDVMLCGSMFPELHVTDDTGRRWLKRHRLFELGGWGNYGIGLQPECQHPTSRPLGIYGSKGDAVPGGGEIARTLDEARALMGMPWASWAGITQAIPPAYTQYLGTALLEHLTTVTA